MDNLRGSLFMVLAMALFALEDMLIKQVSAALPTGQILLVLGIGGTALFLVLLRRAGLPLWTPDYLRGAVLLRTGFELVGTIGYVTALSLIDISTASAILQAVPLVVTFGAAMILNETVGWRRWAAIAVGFGGIVVILRPGADGFEPNSLFALGGMLGLSGRDLVTRRIPATVPGLYLSTQAFAGTILSATILIWMSGSDFVVPGAVDTVRLIATVFTGAVAYITIVIATRTGEVSVVAPFRYSRILFALVVGAVVFGERPDGWMLAGTAVVVASGIYTFLREARVRRRGDAAPVASLARAGKL